MQQKAASNMNYPIILSENTLSVIINSKVHQADRSHPQWEEIKAAINDDSTTDDELISLMSPGEYIRNTLQDSSTTFIDIRGGVLYYGDEPVHSALGLKVIDMIREGFDIQPWITFAENVYANPFKQSRDELYTFLEKANLPITEDGCFIAYKKVNSNYRDVFTDTFDNNIGQVLEMPRELVDNDRNRHCSYGFHFCSENYLKNFGGSHVMLVKINPRDVVSIPNDYNFAKGRTCKYEVIGEIEEAIISDYTWDAVYMDVDDCEGWLEYDSDGAAELIDDEDVPDTWENINIPDWVQNKKNLNTETNKKGKSDNMLTKLKKSVTKGSKKSVTINTERLGTLSRKQFKAAVREHGTMANWARELGVPSSTVRNWRADLWASVPEI